MSILRHCGYSGTYNTKFVDWWTVWSVLIVQQAFMGKSKNSKAGYHQSCHSICCQHKDNSAIELLQCAYETESDTGGLQCGQSWWFLASRSKLLIFCFNWLHAHVLVQHFEQLYELDTALTNKIIIMMEPNDYQTCATTANTDSTGATSLQPQPLLSGSSPHSHNTQLHKVAVVVLGRPALTVTKSEEMGWDSTATATTQPRQQPLHANLATIYFKSLITGHCIQTEHCRSVSSLWIFTETSTPSFPTFEQ